MLREKTISGSELMPRLSEILDEIHSHGAVYVVHAHVCDINVDPAEGIDESGQGSFVLGPPDVCGGVVGLVDPEYGWPHVIDVGDVNTLNDIMPGYRLHPFLHRGSTCLAISITIHEYEMIRKRMRAKQQGHDDPLP